jgi:hypothetical protein
MAIDKTLNPYATAATQLGGVNPNDVDPFMGLSGAADVNAAAVERDRQKELEAAALALNDINLDTKPL